MKNLSRSSSIRRLGLGSFHARSVASNSRQELIVSTRALTIGSLGGGGGGGGEEEEEGKGGIRIALNTDKGEDLSAPVDVYSDWIDACDAVAKDAAATADVDDGLNSYEDLAAGNERRNSEMNIDRHLVSAVGRSGYGGDDFVDDD